MRVHYDWETRATADIKLGVHKYCEHPATEILCLGYAIDDAPAQIWRPRLGEPFPQELIVAANTGATFVAHNDQFDFQVWNTVLRRTHPHVPRLHMAQRDCTMVRALARGLPGGLAQLGAALRMPIEKDTEGAKVMMRLCKPQRKGGSKVWIEDPGLFDILYAYCMQDVEAERPIDDVLPPLTETERAIWHMSERINERGIYIDLANVRRLAELVEAEGKHLSYTVAKLTGGAATATQRQKLLEWLQARGVQIEDMQKSTLRKVRASDDLLDDVREVLEVQSEATKTSTAKLKKMAARVCVDSRVRGEYRYHGAGTGRWSSTGVQVHNFARPDKGFDVAEAEWTYAFSRTRNGRDWIRREFGSVMFAASHSLRPLMTAGPGNELICADYSNIEGRVLAWLAGEHWKLQAFRDFDAGEGDDLYKLAFSSAFGVPADKVDDDQRQVGKVVELACIAAGELVTTDHGLVPIEHVTRAMRVWDGREFVSHDGVVSRGLKLTIVHDGVCATPDHLVFTDAGLPPRPFGELADSNARLARFVGGVRTARRRPGMRYVYDIVNAGPRHRFVVSGVLVHNCGYQGGVGAYLSMAANYNTDLAAMTDVVRRNTDASEWQWYGDKYDEPHAQKFELPKDQWTAIKTLVGKWRDANSAIRKYWYDLEDACVAAVDQPGRATRVGRVFFQVEGNFLTMRLPSGRKLAYGYPELRDVKTPWGTIKQSVRVYGAEKGGYFPYHLYGGLLAENATQAAARDLLAEAMLRLEAAGYPIMLHTHDECAAEVPRGFGSEDDFAALMCQLPEWAAGIPVTVSKPWRGVRYRKG